MKSWGNLPSCVRAASLALACLLVFAFAATSQAAIINFTGAPYNSWTSGPHSYTTSLGDAGLTITAWTTHGQSRNLGYKEESRGGATAAGIGVWGGPAGGEIDPGEVLLFSFDRAVNLASFTTNFQYYEYTNQPQHKRFYEYGKFSLFDGVSWGAWTDFGQTDNMQTYPNPFTPGSVTVSFGSGTQAWALAVKSSGACDHDFTVNQIATAGGSATPEPASMLLFASALGGVGLLGWRRRRKA